MEEDPLEETFIPTGELIDLGACIVRKDDLVKIDLQDGGYRWVPVSKTGPFGGHRLTSELRFIDTVTVYLRSGDLVFYEQNAELVRRKVADSLKPIATYRVARGGATS